MDNFDQELKLYRGEGLIDVNPVYMNWWKNPYISRNPITGVDERLTNAEVIFRTTHEAEMFVEFAFNKENQRKFPQLKGVRKKQTKEQNDFRILMETKRDLENIELFEKNQFLRDGENLK